MSARASKVPTLIGVLPEFADQALALFRNAGFEPDEISRKDTEVKFRFAYVPEDRQWDLCSAIPTVFYSKRATVGGNPFEDER